MTTGKLYLHIGPPKTATSSLQVALSQAKLPGIRYAGAFQPRGNNFGSIAQVIHKATTGGFATGDPDVLEVLNAIREHLSAGEGMVLSEEMFLVGQRDCAFPTKLQRLGVLLADIPTVILLTLRDPVDGLPSLYQELFNSLPLLDKLSFARFCRGPSARCYDYSYVYESLARAGFRDIRGIEFENLAAGEVPLSLVLGNDAPTDATLMLRHMNAGAKTGSDKRKLPPITLRSICGLRWIRDTVAYSSLRGTVFHRYVANICDRVHLSSGDTRQLHMPEDAADHFSRSMRYAYTYLQSIKSSVK